MHRRTLLSAAASAGMAVLTFAACTTNHGPSATPTEAERAIDEGVDTTMATLYSSVPGSKELAGKARGILVFPKVFDAGLVVGGEHGRGALRVDGRTAGYYQTTSLSLGLQAGAQSKSLVFMFMTQGALDAFVRSSGWTAGADASVALAKLGANGVLDAPSGSAEVTAFALANEGLMAAATVDGTKISKLMW